MTKMSRYWRKQYALPTEHGSWIWWVGPLAIGTAAAGGPTTIFPLLFFSALLAFLLRQPLTILVKALSHRRARSDLLPALLWAIGYSLLLIFFISLLLSYGYSEIIWLGLPGVLVFTWHLVLISRRRERGQMGVELVGAGVLALAAPAAYWTSGGTDDRLAWILWGLTWLQSAASIVLVYYRLAQRKLTALPTPQTRFRQGARALLYHSFNLILSLLLAGLDLVSWLIPIAFGAMFLDLVEGFVNPPIGVRPTRIGLRQLGASILFTLVVIIGVLPREGI